MIWVALLAAFCAGVVFGSLQGYRLIETNRTEAWSKGYDTGYNLGLVDAASTIANETGDLWTEDELLQLLEDDSE